MYQNLNFGFKNIFWLLIFLSSKTREKMDGEIVCFFLSWNILLYFESLYARGKILPKQNLPCDWLSQLLL